MRFKNCHERAFRCALGDDEVNALRHTSRQFGNLFEDRFERLLSRRRAGGVADDALGSMIPLY